MAGARDKNRARQDMPEQDGTLVVWRLLRDRRVLIVAVTIGGAAAAWVGSLFIEPLWEATGVIRVALVPKPPEPPELVEPLGHVIDRIGTPEFMEEALSKGPLSDDQRMGLPQAARASLAVKVLPRSDLLEVKVRDRSADGAVRSLELIGTRLAEVHASMAERTFKRLEWEHGILQRKIADLHNLAGLAAKSKRALNSRRSDALDLYVFSTLEFQRRELLFDWEHRVAALEEQLGSRNKHPTYYLKAPQAGPKPVVPQTWAMMVFGAGIGFVLGLAVTFLFDSTSSLNDDVQSARPALR